MILLVVALREPVLDLLGPRSPPLFMYALRKRCPSWAAPTAYTRRSARRWGLRTRWAARAARRPLVTRLWPASFFVLATCLLPFHALLLPLMRPGGL